MLPKTLKPEDMRMLYIYGPTAGPFDLTTILDALSHDRPPMLAPSDQKMEYRKGQPETIEYMHCMRQIDTITWLIFRCRDSFFPPPAGEISFGSGKVKTSLSAVVFSWFDYLNYDFCVEATHRCFDQAARDSVPPLVFIDVSPPKKRYTPRTDATPLRSYTITRIAEEERRAIAPPEEGAVMALWQTLSRQFKLTCPMDIINVDHPGEVAQKFDAAIRQTWGDGENT